MGSNAEALEAPELINRDPYGAGWVDGWTDAGHGRFDVPPLRRRLLEAGLRGISQGLIGGVGMERPTLIDAFCWSGRGKRLRLLHHPIGTLMPRLTGRLNPRVIYNVVRFAGRRVAAPSCGSPPPGSTAPALREYL